MDNRRRPPWLLIIFLGIGLALVIGGFVILRDGGSGVAGTAKVTSCSGSSGRYSAGIHCQGTWQVGGSLVFGNGRIAVGPVEGASRGDVGKTIDVRIHGTDHATKPGLGTPIALWAVGGLCLLPGLAGLWFWWRGRRGRSTLGP